MATTPGSPESFTGRLAPLAALRYRDFRLLWLGQLVSIAGSQMRIVAVNVQIYELAKASGAINPALALGLIGLARAVPLIAVAPFSGLVADRADRRLLLLLTSIGALVASGVLALASGLAAPPIWLIYAMVILAAVVGAFEMPARQALLPSLVSAEHLPNALSLNIIAWQLATIIGPTLAGVLIAWGGVAPVYWIDAASFLAVVLAVVLMRTRPAPRSTEPATLHAALEGLRFVFGRPLIASTMLLDFFATFFGAAMTLLPLFADQVLHVGPVELGWMYAAPSVGAVLAAAFLTSFTIRRQGPVLLWSVAIFGVCTAIFGLSHSLWLTLLALAGSGASDTISMVIRGTIRQLLTPDELRGRMTAVNMVFFAGGPQLGELEAGLLASLLGGPAAVFLGGALCVVLVGAVAWRVGELRRYQGMT
jgi:MFS family permease